MTSVADGNKRWEAHSRHRKQHVQIQEVKKQFCVFWNHKKLEVGVPGVRECPWQKQTGEAGQVQEGFCVPCYIIWVFSYQHWATTEMSGEGQMTNAF